MFEKREIIVSSTMGLCVVADVTRLSADRRAPMLYYVLRSYYDTSKTAYIPVENHEVELRKPMDEEKAADYLSHLKDYYAEDPSYEPDENIVGEVAYVLKMKIEELLESAGAKQTGDSEE